MRLFAWLAGAGLLVFAVAANGEPYYPSTPRWNNAVLPAFVLIALLGNAFICGVFSGPHSRYQSRLVWLPTFVLLLAASSGTEIFQRKRKETA
ncbi:MAG: hypothetical protein WDM89_17190 [Rhizomicrobium sp.]